VPDARRLDSVDQQLCLVQLPQLRRLAVINLTSGYWPRCPPVRSAHPSLWAHKYAKRALRPPPPHRLYSSIEQLRLALRTFMFIRKSVFTPSLLNHSQYDRQDDRQRTLDEYMINSSAFRNYRYIRIIYFACICR
jgi:hypothetical protein